jgi:V/A-type H+-transporting ATPase subunit I
VSIVRMLRATVIGRTTDAEATLSAIQAAGLLHLTPMRPPEEIVAALGRGDGTLEEVARLQRARAAIAAVVEGPPGDAALPLDALATRVGEALDRKERLIAELNAAQATVAALAPWGEIDPADLDDLAARGAPVSFVRMTPSDYRQVDWRRFPHAVARRTDHEVDVAIFGVAEDDLPSTPIRLPRVRLSAAVAERDALAAELRGVERFLGGLARRIPEIDRRLDDLADRAAVLSALGAGLDAGPLYAVAGFLPAENQSDLEKAIRPFAAVLRVEDPEPGEVVPVKLRHGPAIGGFGAIVRAFSGISYWEKDFTPIVMVLFMIFGSLCLIDAGYGLMLLATGAVLAWRGDRDFGSVFLWTGAFSMVVGVLGGQYFGLVIGKDLLVGQAPPTRLADDPMTTFVFSLVAGMVTMMVAYATAVWQRGWRTMATGGLLVALGAIVTAIGMFGAESAVGVALASPSPAQVAPIRDGLTWGGAGLLGLGVLAWLVFPDPVFGPRAHVANVLWTLYSGLTGLGQDIMSHMRLFGICLSGAIMASVINTLAGMLPPAAAIPVAIVGHAFVFVLSLLSLYIHTNRLIFLEFGSKCFDGGQAWYAPLRSRRAAQKSAA